MLYQLSKKIYNNLYTSSRGYLIGPKLEFLNSKIEKRFMKGSYIQNLQKIINLHLFELVFSGIYCFNERENLQIDLIFIGLSIGFLIYLRKCQSVTILQISSLILQFYPFHRLTLMKTPLEFYAFLFIIWGLFHVISWQSMSFLFALIYYSLIQIFNNKEAFLWPYFFQKAQRTIYHIELDIYDGITFRISEIEILYTIFSVGIYYYCYYNIRQNWKTLDQTKRSERAYLNLFQQNTTPTFIVSNQGNILELNEIAKEIFGERRISYTSCSFFKLIQDKKELLSIKNAFEQVTLSKESVNVRANIQIFTNNNINGAIENRGSVFASTQSMNGIGAIVDDHQANKQNNPNNNSTLNSKSPLTNTANNSTTLNTNTNNSTTLTNQDQVVSNSNTRNGINQQSSKRRSNESSVAPSPQMMPQLNSKKQSIASPPIRHIAQIAPPQAKNSNVTKIPYPFLPEQFDDLLKDEYLNITDNVSTTKYYLVTISPFIWKQTTCFLINLVDISETQDFIKISNFFMKNLNERLLSVLSHTEEDYQKWGNLAQLNQIKQTDLRELSAIISEQHSILSLTSLLRQLNQMYIGQEVGKHQDFQITNLFIQTIEVHSVRIQNYLKKIELVFESFPPQANGDPTAFYFVIHSLIYLMTYNCEYNEVDLLINCSLQRYLDRSSSLVLSFEFDFVPTQEQITFFNTLTKEFEDQKRCLVQSDLMGHDILETLYLMTLNTIKQNGGSIHLEQVDVNKKNEPQQQNQPQSSQNIPPPNNKDSTQQQNKPDNQDQKKENQAPRFKVVLEQTFNTAEMHTVVKRQGEKSILDSPAAAPNFDKKGGGRKYHALTKPPQINLSYTRLKEKLKETYYWKQCKEEDKKLQAQIGISSIRRPELSRVRNFQNFGIDSDENIPSTQQRSNQYNNLNQNIRSDSISPLTANKVNPRKASTHILNINEEPKSQSNNIPPPNSNQINSGQNLQSQSSHSQVNQTNPSQKDINNLAPNPPSNAPSAQIIQVTKLNSSGQINQRKNLENISESVENIDRIGSNINVSTCTNNNASDVKKAKAKQKSELDSQEGELDINDELSEDTHALALANGLKKQIKTYLKLYNSNIIKDLSKIVKNVLSTTKMHDDIDLRFIDKSSHSLSALSHNVAQFHSPQPHHSKPDYRPSPLVHSAFQNYVNPEKIEHKIYQPSPTIKNCEEQTPKSVTNSTRPSKTSFPSLILNSPLVVNNFRFRGESRSSECSKEQPLQNKNQNKQDTKQKPWDQVFCWEVHQSRSQKHIRKWILSDVWNRLYKKSDTVLVLSADLSDQSVMKQVFQQKKDLGRELVFVRMHQGFQKYMEYLNNSEVFKYILIDLRLNLIEIGEFIDNVRAQESQSTAIPKAHFVGFNGIEHCVFNFHLDHIVVGEVGVLKLIDFIKVLKENK